MTIKYLVSLCVLSLSACASEPNFPPFIISDPPSYIVFFDWDSVTPHAQGLNTIKQVANQYVAVQSAHPRITVQGHTDSSGPASYNLTLSRRRADAVKAILIADGVPEQAIQTVGNGESKLLVMTPDGVREPQNRRVEIWVQ